MRKSVGMITSFYLGGVVRSLNSWNSKGKGQLFLEEKRSQIAPTSVVVFVWLPACSVSHPKWRAQSVICFMIAWLTLWASLWKPGYCVCKCVVFKPDISICTFTTVLNLCLAQHPLHDITYFVVSFLLN
jgi:protein-S-isoprenylcysteine O-methyltransferase Ste14